MTRMSRRRRHDARGRAGGGAARAPRSPATSRRRSKPPGTYLRTRDTAALAAFVPLRLGCAPRAARDERAARPREREPTSARVRRRRSSRRSTPASPSWRCAMRSRIASSTWTVPPTRPPRNRVRAPRSATCSPTSRSSASSRRRRSPPSRARCATTPIGARSRSCCSSAAPSSSARSASRSPCARSARRSACSLEHARSLSDGDLTVRTTERLPAEFQILAEAMNQTGDSLSRVVSVAAQTSADVASSATQLASVSEEIAALRRPDGDVDDRASPSARKNR